MHVRFQKKLEGTENNKELKVSVYFSVVFNHQLEVLTMTTIYLRDFTIFTEF